MNPKLSRLQPYPFERLRALLAGVTPPAGIRPISLGIGEPRHPAPEFLKQALAGALGQGLSSYPATAGEPALREACAGWVQRRYGVRRVIVVEATEPGNDESIKQAIGSAAAHYLETSLSPQDHIGISSWSSTIRAMVGHLHAQPGKQGAQEVVQLLGGVGNKGAFEATLLTQRLATLLNCPAYLLPSQSIEQSVESKQRIVQMEEVKEVLQRFDSITLAIVGIGDLEPSQLLRNSGNYYTEDMLRLPQVRPCVCVCVCCAAL